MAVEGPTGGASKRRPSFRGEVVQRVSRGVEITQRWPKASGKRRSQKTKDQNEFFRQVQWAWKFTDARLIAEYTNAVARTPLLPRDLFLSAMSGRLLAFRLPTGELVSSVPANNDVSNTLDFLESRVGSMLIRTPEGWLGLAAGEGGQVLTMDLADGLPAWKDAQGGGGTALAAIPEPLSGELRLSNLLQWATASSLMLRDCYNWRDRQITKVVLPVSNWTSSHIVRPVAYEWGNIADAPEVTTGATFLGEGPEQNIPGHGLRDLFFDEPITLEAGKMYLIGCFKRGSTTNMSLIPAVNNRRGYSNAVALAAPPAVLPALTISDNAIFSLYTD